MSLSIIYLCQFAQDNDPDGKRTLVVLCCFETFVAFGCHVAGIVS